MSKDTQSVEKLTSLINQANSDRAVLGYDLLPLKEAIGKLYDKADDSASIIHVVGALSKVDAKDTGDMDCVVVPNSSIGSTNPSDFAYNGSIGKWFRVTANGKVGVVKFTDGSRNVFNHPTSVGAVLASGSSVSTVNGQKIFPSTAQGMLIRTTVSLGKASLGKVASYDTRSEILAKVNKSSGLTLSQVKSALTSVKARLPDKTKLYYSTCMTLDPDSDSVKLHVVYYISFLGNVPKVISDLLAKTYVSASAFSESFKPPQPPNAMRPPLPGSYTCSLTVKTQSAMEILFGVKRKDTAAVSTRVRSVDKWANKVNDFTAPDPTGASAYFSSAPKRNSWNAKLVSLTSFVAVSF